MAYVLTAVFCVVVTYSKISTAAMSSSGSVKMGSAVEVRNERETRFDITIGSDTKVHPQAVIIAEAGPIIIGTNNVIDERAVIINRLPPGGTPSSTPVLVIGNNNVFQPDSYTEALKIGNDNVLHSNCFLGREVELSNNCVVGEGSRLTCCNRTRERTPNLRGADVCNDCELRGITIGSNTVINSRAAIIAEAGPVIIGANNVIGDRAVIINRLPPGGTPSSKPVLTIGNRNVIEFDSHSEARKIGNDNVLKSKCFVGREVELGNNCVVGAGCRYTCPAVVADNSVVCDSQCY